MIEEMMGKHRVPCDLTLIRSPSDYAPQDPSLPGIRPGLYVGDYGHDFYGQFKTEVLLLEYVVQTKEEMLQERDGCYSGPRKVFQDSSGRTSPMSMSVLNDLPLEEGITFARGVKQTGDFHVPMGACTFVALCGPASACNAIAGSKQPPKTLVNRQTNRRMDVIHSWRGFGTLAMPGFYGPEWAGGWFVQVWDGAGGNRFGFMWDRHQDVVVLQWIGAQDKSPFLQREWLPDDLQ